MSKPSQEYLSKIEKWILGGHELKRMNMTYVQKFRARICYEAYQMWLQDRQIQPTSLMSRIAQRDYAVIIQRAREGDEEARMYLDALNIKDGVPRTISEISNDVYVLNWLIKRFDVATDSIEKAKVQDASDWLIREGKRMGDAKAVKSGADLKLVLNNNFTEGMDAALQMPNPNINITGDVTIVKSDAVNYTEEEIRKLARQYGLTQSEVKEMMQNQDGVYEEIKDNSGKDYFTEDKQ